MINEKVEEMQPPDKKLKGLVAILKKALPNIQPKEQLTTSLPDLISNKITAK